MSPTTLTGRMLRVSDMLRTSDLAGRCARLLGALLLLITSLSGIGCAADLAESAQGPLWADPGIVRLSPTRTRVHVEIHNRSGTVRPIGDFALAGDDWDALRFVDPALPRTIPAYDSVVLELELSPASFRAQPGVYRSGRAALTFSSHRFAYEVPIEFVGSDVDRSGLGGVLVSTLALAGLALAALARSGARQPGRDGGPLSLRFAVSGAFAAVLLVAASIPIGLGLCHGRLLDRVGPRELEQCRQTLGGAELLALPGSPGIWWWLVALALVCATLTIVRTGLPAAATTDARPAPALALAGLRLLTFTLLLVALVCGLAPASAKPTDLLLSQAQFVEVAGLHLPRWGLVAQPLGFALAFVLVTQSIPKNPAANPIVATLERLNALIWASLLATLYLGGPTIPALTQRPVPLLPHAPQLALEFLTFALKVAAILYLATRLQPQPTNRQLKIQTRWIIPLALLNLATILVWRSI